MNDSEKLIIHYRQLCNLFREDYSEIAKCMNGEILDAYRGVLKSEEDQRKKLEKMILKLYYN